MGHAEQCETKEYDPACNQTRFDTESTKVNCRRPSRGLHERKDTNKLLDNQGNGVRASMDQGPRIINRQYTQALKAGSPLNGHSNKWVSIQKSVCSAAS